MLWAHVKQKKKLWINTIESEVFGIKEKTHLLKLNLLFLEYPK
jgi:hypothetical protein